MHKKYVYDVNMNSVAPLLNLQLEDKVCPIDTIIDKNIL
jgi:hypothetical protein